MRNELERSQQIDCYLDGEMDAKEKMQFEAEMVQDKRLRQEVEAQRQLRESIFQRGIKKAAQKAFKKMKLYKKLFWGGAGVVVLAIAGICFLFLNENNLPNNDDNTTDPKTITQQNLGENYMDPNERLESQFYNIKNGADTILETQNGMLVVLPNHGFINASGDAVEGDITLEIKEAFDPASIMQSGLSTTSDGQMLETGGMFYIKAFQNGEELKVNPDDPMVVDIPTKQKDKNMMLFDGEVQEDGTINWANPKKFENWLMPVDILSLNFYPPNYLLELEKLGQNASDKNFTDSLYYSFEGACDGVSYSQFERSYEIEDTIGNKVESPQNVLLLTSLLLQAGIVPTEAIAVDSTAAYTQCGINPSKIKAIWQEKFNNTNLATKEFEQRIPTIHRSCENSVLDVYVNNLDQSLSYCDSLAATLSAGDVKKKLRAFAQNGDGRVQMNNRQAKRLAQYYQRKQKQYSKILQKTQEEFWAKQRKLDQEAIHKGLKNDAANYKRQREMLQQELDKNLDEAYRQLGKRRPQYRSEIKGVVTTGYVAPIRNTGWKNVDQYVQASTSNRKSLNYTSPDSGKKAEIQYGQISLTVAKRNQFDEVFVYFIPKGLSSFNRAEENGKGFAFQLNELFQYDLMIVGMQKEDIFTYQQETVTARSYGILTLAKTSRQQFDKMSGQYSWSNTRKDLQQDLDYYLFKRKDDQRQAHNQKRKEFREQLMEVVFPCNDFQAVVPVQVDDEIEKTYTVVAELPKFPGGEEALRNYFKIDGADLHDNVFVRFTVSKEGLVTNPKIISGKSKYDGEIIKRIINMPRWIPGEDSNGPIDVPYTYKVEL